MNLVHAVLTGVDCKENHEYGFNFITKLRSVVRALQLLLITMLCFLSPAAKAQTFVGERQPNSSPEYGVLTPFKCTDGQSVFGLEFENVRNSNSRNYRSLGVQSIRFKCAEVDNYRNIKQAKWQRDVSARYPHWYKGSREIYRRVGNRPINGDRYLWIKARTVSSNCRVGASGIYYVTSPHITINGSSRRVNLVEETHLWCGRESGASLNDRVESIRESLPHGRGHQVQFLQCPAGKIITGVRPYFDVDTETLSHMSIACSTSDSDNDGIAITEEYPGCEIHNDHDTACRYVREDFTNGYNQLFGINYLGHEWFISAYYSLILRNEDHSCQSMLNSIARYSGVEAPKCRPRMDIRLQQVMDALCPDGLKRCQFTKSYAQYIDFESLGVGLDRGWMNIRQISGVGARVQANAPHCLDEYGYSTRCFEPTHATSAGFSDKPEAGTILDSELFTTGYEGFDYVLWSIEGDIPESAFQKIARLSSLPRWIFRLLRIIRRFFDPDYGQSKYFAVEERNGIRKITAPLAVHPSAFDNYNRGRDVVGVYIQNQECKNRYFLYGDSRKLLTIKNTDDHCLVKLNKHRIFDDQMKSVSQNLVRALKLNKFEANYRRHGPSIDPTKFYGLNSCAVDIRQDLWQDFVYGASDEFPDLSAAISTPRFNCELNYDLIEVFSKLLDQNAVNREIRRQKRINISREVLLAAGFYGGAAYAKAFGSTPRLLLAARTAARAADGFIILYYLADGVVSTKSCFDTHRERTREINQNGVADQWIEAESISGQHGAAPPLKARPYDVLGLGGSNNDASSLLIRCVASATMTIAYNALLLSNNGGQFRDIMKKWQGDLADASAQYGIRIRLNNGSVATSLEELNDAFSQAVYNSRR